MASAEAPGHLLTDEQRTALLALVGEADSVELKLTVPESAQRSAVAALELDPLAAQIRQVWFFDTPELTLNRAGVVVRARRVQRRPDDTVVKLRPVVPHELPRKLRRAPGFGVEVDAMPGGFVCSASSKGVAESIGTLDVVRGGRPLRKLFTKPQRALFDAHAPDGLALDDLTPLGPLFVLKLKSSPRTGIRKLVTELWLLPDGSRILELSTRCRPDEAFEVAAVARAFLSERGIDLSGEQQTKTRQALDLLSRELAATG